MSTTGNGTGGRAHTSDAGWGCMLRSAQMLLSNALLRHAATVAPGDWALPPPLPLRSHNDANAAAAAAVVTGGGTLPLLLPHLPPALLATLALFADCPGATFSVHTLCDWGARRLGKKPGEWFGPSETAWIVRHAVTAAQALPPTCAGGAALPAWLGAHALALEVAEHGTVYLDRLVKWSLGQRPERIQWERRAPLSAPACAPAPASASLSDAASLTALTAGIDPDPQPQPAAAVAAAGAGAGAGEVVAALRREAAAAAAAASAAAAAGQGPDVSHLHAHERSPASLQRPPSSYSPFPGSSAADATNSAAGAGAGAGVDAGAGWRPLLLLVPVRLGIDHVDPSYIESLLMCFHCPVFAGAIGGRPRASLFFTGAQDSRLFYLDPHTVQPALPPGAGTSPQHASAAALGSYFCPTIQSIEVAAIDPCLTLAFYLPTEDATMQFWAFAKTMMAHAASAEPAGSWLSVITADDLAPCHGSGSDSDDDDGDDDDGDDEGGSGVGRGRRGGRGRGDGGPGYVADDLIGTMDAEFFEGDDDDGADADADTDAGAGAGAGAGEGAGTGTCAGTGGRKASRAGAGGAGAGAGRRSGGGGGGGGGRKQREEESDDGFVLL